MKLVLFDLDDTLIQDDSAKLWLKFCIEKRFFTSRIFRKNRFLSKTISRKKLDMDEFMTFFFKALRLKMKIEFHL